MEVRADQVVVMASLMSDKAVVSIRDHKAILGRLEHLQAFLELMELPVIRLR